MVGGSWFERVVCPCLFYVELFDMSHDHSESLEGQSCDNAEHDASQETLMTLNFLKVIRNSSLKLLFLIFKLSLILI